MTPAEVKALPVRELPRLARDVRARILDVVGANGGHLASSLGAVELAIGLVRVFEPARDRIVWDVGHQAYAWKILTGRDGAFDTLRRLGGLSGFPNPDWAGSPASPIPRSRPATRSCPATRAPRLRRRRGWRPRAT